MPLVCSTIWLKQPQQYVLRICNFTHLGSLKRDHIKYRFQREERESEKEIKKRFVCQSIPTRAISLVMWKSGGEKGRGQLSVNLPMKCWQNSQFSVIFLRPSFSSSLTQNPFISNSGALRPLTCISSPGLPLAGQRDVTVVPFRSGGRRLRSQHYKGCHCLSSRISWAPVKG